MEKLLRNIRDILVFILVFIIGSIIINYILKKTDNDIWFEKRNRHRIYDPVEQDYNEDHYINNIDN